MLMLIPVLDIVQVALKLFYCDVHLLLPIRMYSDNNRYPRDARSI